MRKGWPWWQHCPTETATTLGKGIVNPLADLDTWTLGQSRFTIIPCRSHGRYGIISQVNNRQTVVHINLSAFFAFLMVLHINQPRPAFPNDGGAPRMELPIR